MRYSELRHFVIGHLGDCKESCLFMDLIHSLIERDFLEGNMERYSQKREFSKDIESYILKLEEIALLIDPENMENKHKDLFARNLYKVFMGSKRFIGLTNDDKKKRLKVISEDLKDIHDYLDAHLWRKEKAGATKKVDREGFLTVAIDAYACAFARMPITTEGKADYEVFRAIYSVVDSVPSDFKKIYVRLVGAQRDYWRKHMPNWNNIFYWTSVDWTNQEYIWVCDYNAGRGGCFTWIE